MESIKMKYMDFEFCVNPKSLKISCSKHFSSGVPITGFESKSETAVAPRVITGSGIFSGSDAVSNILRFESLLRIKGGGTLFLPELAPQTAFFSKLDYEISAENNAVYYSFEFIQSKGDAKALADFGFTYALSGENAFSIANRTGVAIEKIMAVNGYPEPFCIKVGEKVLLE